MWKHLIILCFNNKHHRLREQIISAWKQQTIDHYRLKIDKFSVATNHFPMQFDVETHFIYVTKKIGVETMTDRNSVLQQIIYN